VRPLPTLLSLLDGLLTYDPRRRLDAPTVLSHSWFSERPLPVTPQRLAAARLPQAAVDHGLFTPELRVVRQAAHGAGSHHRPAKRGNPGGGRIGFIANLRHEERLTACAQDMREEEEELGASPQRKQSRREEGGGSVHGSSGDGMRPARAIRIPSPTSISASASRQL
jgi:serine/threonine protein kinase